MIWNAAAIPSCAIAVLALYGKQVGLGSPLMQQTFMDELKGIAPICIFYLLALCIVGLDGQFPLNDDWTYGLSVLDLVNHGAWNIEYSSTPCYLHIGIGYLVSKIAGFSYPVLRLVTMTASLFCTVSIYLSARELGLGERFSSLISLLFAVNPIALNLSFSFMTDIPAMAFASGFLLFFIRWLKFEGRWNFVLATVFLIAALAVRYSYGIYVPATLVSLVFLRIDRKRNLLLVFLFLVLLPAIFVLSLTKTSGTIGVNPNFHVYGDALKSVLAHWFHNPLEAIVRQMDAFGSVLLYLGLFLSPVLGTLQLREWISRQDHRGRTFFLLVFAISSAVVFLLNFNEIFMHRNLMPLAPNIMSLPQVGVLSILIADAPDVGFITRVLITVISFVFAGVVAASFFVLAVRMLNNKDAVAVETIDIRDGSSGRELAFFLLLISIFSVSIVAIQLQILNIDRYVLVAVPPVILLVGYVIQALKFKLNFRMATCLVSVLGLFSIAATQDYLAWNRVRWRAVELLQSKGVSPEIIDGGYEFNLLNDPTLYKVTRPKTKLFQFIQPEGVTNRAYRWWPAKGEKFVISFAPLSDYSVVSEEHYFSLLFMTEQKIYVLEKNVVSQQ